MKLFTEYIKPIIAFFVVMASFAYFFFTYFIGKAQADPQIIIAIIAALTQVLSYYYGSSQGAAKKDETIASLSSNPVITNSENTTVNQDVPKN